MSFISLFDLVQAIPWFWSFMRISSVARISKILYMYIVADGTRTTVRMLDSLRHKLLVLKTGDKVGQSPACHG